MKNIRIKFDTKRELDNKQKYEWMKGKKVTMTEYRSAVYEVGQAVLEKEFSKNIKFWDGHLKRANQE
jgi:hypothetical protein